MAIAHTLVETAELDDVVPQAWFIRVFGEIADQKIERLDDLTPRRCAAQSAQ